ncbi:MAG: hypothetical protein AAF549_03650 [Pseudomonadota bacterium]
MVKAFEDAKKRVLKPYNPGKNIVLRRQERRIQRMFDDAGLRIATNYYGELIDRAVSSVKEKGSLTDELKAEFAIVLRNNPHSDEGMGRLAKYHKRFEKQMKKIDKKFNILGL